MKSSISYQDYLAAKKEIDDAALNSNVFSLCLDALRRKENPEIIELGAGTGAMAERFLEAGVAFKKYILVDELEENTLRSYQHLLDVIAKNNLPHSEEGQSIIVKSDSVKCEFLFATADCFEYLHDNAGRFDLLIACALIDLLPMRKAVKSFLSALKPGGLFYFPINFDGETIFEPVTDREREARLMREYHRTMDERTINKVVSGDSKTGRKLFSVIPELGGEILSAGASDWIVFPSASGYRGDTAVFLRFILDTVRGALENIEAVSNPELISWYNERLGQLNRGELTYIAHQLDVFGKVSTELPI